MTFKITVTELNKSFELDIHDEVISNANIELTSIDEKSLRTTSRYRTELKRLANAFYTEFREKTRVHLRAIWHNLSNTQIQIIQTTERYTRLLNRDDRHLDRVELLAEIISKDPKKVAEDLIFIEQRAVDLDAQLIGINLIIGKPYTLDLETHPLHDVLLRCVWPFLQKLREKISVSVDINNIDRSITLLTDFNLFNCALYHFFDNAVKYVRPETSIKIFLDNDNTLVFQMISRALEDGEQISIFREGVTGKNSKEGRGEGLGLFVFDEVMRRLDATREVVCHPQTRLGFENHMYQLQEFKIKFNKGFIQNSAASSVPDSYRSRV